MSRRNGLVLASLVAIAAAGAASPSVRAKSSEPMLGATVEAIVYADEDPAVSVLNRSNVPALFSLELDGIGWTVAASSFVLEPGMERAVPVSRIGPQEARLRVRVAATAETAPGVQRGEILLESRLLPERPFDPTSLLMAGGALLVLVVGTTSAVVVRRRREP